MRSGATGGGRRGALSGVSGSFWSSTSAGSDIPGSYVQDGGQASGLLRAAGPSRQNYGPEHTERPAFSGSPGRQIPPRQRYLISRNSSIPYFEPSRPSPDSLTPPNGATSVEMRPVL